MILPSITLRTVVPVKRRSHSDADVQKSIAYRKWVKFYPLSEIGDPLDTVFVDVKDKDFDSTIKYD